MTWPTATILMGGIATLAIYSFLIKENPFYRFFEHLFIGIAAAWGIVFSFKNFIWPDLLVPMLGLDVMRFPDGTTSHPYQAWTLLYIFPMLFGLLFYFVYSKRYAWLAKVAIGFMLGVAGGAELEGFFNLILPQIIGSFKPLVVFEGGSFDWFASVSNWVFLLTLISVMYYFFFTFPRRSPQAEKLATTGRWLMMVCFGAYFGSTVMARMALLVERLDFLISKWGPTMFSLFT